MMNKLSEKKPLIVIIEDDKDLADLISKYLENSGMLTQICHDGAHVERFVKSNFSNLLLLDINLPDGSGLRLFQQLRAKGIQTPVIFLTGENSESKKVSALEMGGDDYITKPFGFPELVARIHAVLRRAGTRKTATSLQMLGYSTPSINFVVPKSIHI